MKRYAGVVELKEDKIQEYIQLHGNVWPDVLKKIAECNIRNCSIYLRKFPDNRHYLFSYFEYVGNDFDADMAEMASDTATQKWWDVCKPCHEPFDNREPGQWWAEMEEVFHCD